MNRRGSGSGVHSLDRDVDSAEFREWYRVSLCGWTGADGVLGNSWVRRDTTCDQAALLLATSQSRPGTFVLVFGPEPSFMSALVRMGSRGWGGPQGAPGRADLCVATVFFVVLALRPRCEAPVPTWEGEGVARVAA